MFAFCNPADVRRQVEGAGEKLHLPEGGLMMKVEFHGADMPIKNIEAMCEAVEEFSIRQR